MGADEIREGAVVRYVGLEPKGWLERGNLACVMQVTGGGRVRLRGPGGSPQWADLSELELVSATDAGGLFDRARGHRKKAGGEPPKGDSVTMTVDAITVDPGVIRSDETGMGTARRSVADEPIKDTDPVTNWWGPTIGDVLDRRQADWLDLMPEGWDGGEPVVLSDAEMRVLAAWPRYEDGGPVLWGDVLGLDEDACGAASGRVVDVRVNASTYVVECAGGTCVVNVHGQRQRRGGDSLSLVLAEAAMAIDVGGMDMGVFERLLDRALALPGEGGES